jgi:hypothetical protein
MTRKRTVKKLARKDPLLRRYRAALREDRLSKGDLEAFNQVKIVSPAVRPKDVPPRAIRQAVREAMLEYVERHATTLERT